MRITTSDVVVTLLVAAVVVPYVGYLARGEMPFVQDPRGMGGIGVLFGLVAVLLVGPAAFHRDVAHRVALTSGVAALGLGGATIAVGTSEVLLGLFIAAIVVTWALGEFAAHHAPLPTGRPLVRPV
jgi:hypothetical protein